VAAAALEATAGPNQWRWRHGRQRRGQIGDGDDARVRGARVIEELRHRSCLATTRYRSLRQQSGGAPWAVVEGADGPVTTRPGKIPYYRLRPIHFGH
jgi:hypothetical protein